MNDGTKMTVPAETVADSCRSKRVVPEGVICIRCGYDLRTLAVEGNCPECGAPVAYMVDAMFFWQRLVRCGRVSLALCLAAFGLMVVGVCLLISKDPAGSAIYFLLGWIAACVACGWAHGGEAKYGRRGLDLPGELKVALIVSISLAIPPTAIVVLVILARLLWW